jgi:hypothetical protein
VSNSLLSFCTYFILSSRKTSSKNLPENAEAAAGLPAHLQRYLINKFIFFISTDKIFNSTDPNVFLTRAGSVWPRLPALAWPLPSHYRLLPPNSPTLRVNVDQICPLPASIAKKNYTKFQVTARIAIPSPNLVKPAPTLAVPTTTTTTKVI